MVEAINEAAIDRYTSAHAGMGVMMAKWRFPWLAALATSVVWEVVENGVKRSHPELFPYSSPDSWQNATFDTLAVMLGYAVTEYSLKKGLSHREKAALAAIVGATIGGALGSVVFGAASGPQDQTSRARLGYRIGGAVGGGVGTMLGGYGPITGAAAAVAGGFAGPVGAGLAAYLTSEIFEEEQHVELVDFYSE